MKKRDIIQDLANRQRGYSESNRIGALVGREAFTASNTTFAKNAEIEAALAFVSYEAVRIATFTSSTQFTFQSQRIRPIPDVDYLQYNAGDLFSIFINGVLIPSNAWSYVESTESLIFTFDISLIGFELSNTDEVKGVGKFETIN